MWCPFAVQTFTSNDQSRTHTRWKESNVRSFRNKRGIPVYRESERRARNEMTLSEAAAALQINPQKARRLIKNGDLPARQLCKGAPWIISATDVASLRAGQRPGAPQLSLVR